MYLGLSVHKMGFVATELAGTVHVEAMHEAKKRFNTLCLTGISSMFSIKSKICQTSDGQEKFASNSIFDFLMKTEMF